MGIIDPQIMLEKSALICEICGFFGCDGETAVCRMRI